MGLFLRFSPPAVPGGPCTARGRSVRRPPMELLKTEMPLILLDLFGFVWSNCFCAPVVALPQLIDNLSVFHDRSPLDRKVEMNAARLTGGCVCGAVRFEVEAVFDVGYCHCNFCRKTSGAPISAVAWIRGDLFRLICGDPRARSQPVRINYCCDDCGSGNYLEIHDRDHLLAPHGHYYCVPVGSFDDPEQVPPRIHQFVDES